MKHKNLIIILVLIFFIGMSLNRMYAHIYNHIDNENLVSKVFDYSQSIKLGDGVGDSVVYVAMGDSLTYGVGASSIENTFPYYFASSLVEKDKNVEMFNLGIPGAKVGGMIDMELDRAIELQPDHVTVFIGTNDMHGFDNCDEFGNKLGMVLGKLKEQTDAKVLLINVPYLGGKSLILPPFNYFFDKLVKKYNIVIKELSIEYGVSLVDLYSSTKEAFDNNPELYSSDGLHPSDAGYKYWSKFIYAN